MSSSSDDDLFDVDGDGDTFAAQQPLRDSDSLDDTREEARDDEKNKRRRSSSPRRDYHQPQQSLAPQQTLMTTQQPGDGSDDDANADSLGLEDPYNTNAAQQPLRDDSPPPPQRDYRRQQTLTTTQAYDDGDDSDSPPQQYQPPRQHQPQQQPTDRSSELSSHSQPTSGSAPRLVTKPAPAAVPKRSEPPRPGSGGGDESSSDDEEMAALFRAESAGRKQPSKPSPSAPVGQQRSSLLDRSGRSDSRPTARQAQAPQVDAARAFDLAPALHGLGDGVLKRRSPASSSPAASADSASADSSQDRRRQRQQQHHHQPAAAAAPISRADGASTQPPRKRARPSPSPALPAQPFRLIMVKGISAEANAGCPRLRSLLKLEGMTDAVLSNYMYEFHWLLRECPYLENLPRLTILHHARDAQQSAEMELSKPANACLHAPQLPVPYGTMHSKCALLFAPTQLRVMITTANYIAVDWENKTQAIWCQDFPLKSESDYENGRTSGEFEESLVEYFEVVGGFDVIALRKYDFSGARGRLVASVPGYHRNDDIKKWGHMRLRALLEEIPIASKFDTVVCQYSSMGTVNEKWIRQNWLPSVSAAACGLGSASRAPAKLQLIIPTEAEVRDSVEGWPAGGAIPIQRAKHKEYMREFREPNAYTDQGFAVNHGQTVDLYHRWTCKDNGAPVGGGAGSTLDDGCSGRSRAMPHIKSFARYCAGDQQSGQQQPAELAWALVTSHNFGPSPWGDLQKAQSQLMVRSYELGVLITPETERAAQVAAGATDVTSVRLLHGTSAGAGSASGSSHSRSSSGGPAPAGGGEVISWIPLPYSIPPAPYRQQDVPWANDDPQRERDWLGNSWPVGADGVVVTRGHAAPPPQIFGGDGSGGSGSQQGAAVSVHQQQHRQQQLQRQQRQQQKKSAPPQPALHQRNLPQQQQQLKNLARGGSSGGGGGGSAAMLSDRGSQDDHGAAAAASSQPRVAVSTTDSTGQGRGRGGGGASLGSDPRRTGHGSTGGRTSSGGGRGSSGSSPPSSGSVSSSGSAQWSWKAGAGWQPYDSVTTTALERSHGHFYSCKRDGSDPGPHLCVEIGGGRHVNLAQMLQVVTASPTRTRHVRRRGPAPSGFGAGASGGGAVHVRDKWV